MSKKGGNPRREGILDLSSYPLSRMSYAKTQAKNMYIIAAVSDIVDATSKKGEQVRRGHTLVSKILEEFPDKKMVPFPGFFFPIVRYPPRGSSHARHTIHPRLAEDPTTFAASKQKLDESLPTLNFKNPTYGDLLEDKWGRGGCAFPERLASICKLWGDDICVQMCAAAGSGGERRVVARPPR
ncbi:Tubulin beta-2 chain [Chionoecetes opilio]|uniref:Tubulin beta-2 chain n=1 Tax=Chionoecetes opilio TaxID=41210 RepID=A0A8J4YG83_CHIOP|nr:Tubulin beta-2 chain [Chionoecetes opilio]